MIKIIKKYKDIILYLVFGVLTTAVNIIVYYLAYELVELSNLISTVIAWIMAVLFAFFTNKKYVFKSSSQVNKSIREMVDFFICRIGTGIVEVGMMFLFVDILLFNGTIMKLVTNFVVIVLNYAASKFYIFKEKRNIL